MDRLCLQASALAQVLEAVGHLRDISDAAARAAFSRGDVCFAIRPRYVTAGELPLREVGRTGSGTLGLPESLGAADGAKAQGTTRGRRPSYRFPSRLRIRPDTPF